MALNFILSDPLVLAMLILNLLGVTYHLRAEWSLIYLTDAFLKFNFLKIFLYLLDEPLTLLLFMIL